MKGIVAGTVAFRLLLPDVVSLQRIVLAGRAAHLDERSSAANERGLARRGVRVFRKGCHKGQVDVNMGVDEAGKDQLPGCIDHLGPRRNGEAGPDGADGFILDEDVAAHATLRRHNLSALDQHSHLYALPSCAAMALKMH